MPELGGCYKSRMRAPNFRQTFVYSCLEFVALPRPSRARVLRGWRRASASWVCVPSGRCGFRCRCGCRVVPLGPECPPCRPPLPWVMSHVSCMRGRCEARFLLGLTRASRRIWSSYGQAFGTSCGSKRVDCSSREGSRVHAPGSAWGSAHACRVSRAMARHVFLSRG